MTSQLNPFKAGDILKLNDEAMTTNWPGEKWRRARFKVIRLLDEHSLGGNQILRIERLDLPSHARQSWAAFWFEKAEGVIPE